MHYKSVNTSFAEKVVDNVRDGDYVWVHGTCPFRFSTPSRHKGTHVKKNGEKTIIFFSFPE